MAPPMAHESSTATLFSTKYGPGLSSCSWKSRQPRAYASSHPLAIGKGGAAACSAKAGAGEAARGDAAPRSGDIGLCSAGGGVAAAHRSAWGEVARGTEFKVPTPLAVVV